MIREIIDMPLPFATMLNVDWAIDWRGQSAAATNGNEQVVFNRFPRWIGTPELVVFPEMLGEWRALISRGRGRVNAWRVRMVDHGVFPLNTAGRSFDALRKGLYVEPRPQVPAVAAASPGASTITVDETGAPRPIPVGAILSYDDWPFMVEGRSGSGTSTVLSVAMLRKAIPEGGQIDLIARGVFLAASDAMGWPSYDASNLARPKLELVEWITR